MVSPRTIPPLALAAWLAAVAFSFVGPLPSSGQAAEDIVTPPWTAVVVAPGAKQVVACSQAGLGVFDWPSLKRVATVDCQVANPHALAFSPDGKRLAVAGGSPGWSGELTVLRWPQRTVERRLTRTEAGAEDGGVDHGHTDSIMAVAWRDEERMVTASLDQTVMLWELKAADTDQHLARSLAGRQRRGDASSKRFGHGQPRS